MEKKKQPVSEEKKRAALEQAAAAKKAAEAKKAAKKEAAAVAEGEPEAVKEAPKAPKADSKAVLTAEDRKTVRGLRIGAIVCWVLALACEVLAFFALRWAVANNASFPSKEIWLLIAALVVDVVFCIIAAQLWKKSNRIAPSLASSKLVRTLWHQLGVIMVLICFLPIGIILLLKSKNMDQKTKMILTVLVAALFVGATTSSVDFQQPSQERVEQLQQEAIAASAAEQVYWTQFGKSYHFDRDCQHIRNKTPIEEGGTLVSGTLEEAFDANRWDPCNICAAGDQFEAPAEDASAENAA
ncbi:MAG: G-protein coupled receptor [Clostridiales bacterium]|nr:G-protein coupled receptor [Clostridiales bacterium]